MASAITKRPSDHDWESNRDLLEDLYTNGSMRDVMSHMKVHFGWDAKYAAWVEATITEILTDLMPGRTSTKSG